MENNTIPAPNKHRKILILTAAFILIALPITIFLASRSQPTENRTQAAFQKAETLTNEIVTSDESPAETLTKAQERKDIMENLAEVSPESFLLSAVDSEAKSTLPTSSEKIVEEEVEKTGYINLRDMESENEDYIFAEIDSNGELIKTYTFLPSKKIKKKIELNEKVKVRGYILDEKFVPYRITKENVLQAQTSEPEVHRIAIIPVNFSDKNDQEYTKAELENRFFNDSNSVAKYYSDISFGRIQITGKVFAPVTLNIRAADLCRRADFLYYALRYPTEDADDKVIARGESLAGYQHRAYIFPRLGPTPINTLDNPCTFIAQATIGDQTGPDRNFSRMMVNGHYFQSNLTSRTTVLVHEFGHNLGLGHADTISCGSKPIDFYTNCTDDEYGDHSDVMGFQYHYFPQIGAHNKWKLGFIPQENLQLYNTEGSYNIDLYTSSKRSANKQIIRIPRRNIGDSLFVEYRQPIGFDRNLPGAVTGGAMIKIGPTNKFSVRNNVYKTYLIDTKPGGNPGDRLDRGWFDDAALRNGQEFFDHVNNVRIKQVDRDADKVTLNVTIGDLPCFRREPDISVSPGNRSGVPGAEKTFEITIDNNDLNGCGSTEYSLEANLPSDQWVAELGNGKLTVNAQASATKSFTIRSAPTASEGIKNLSLKISARNGNLTKTEGFKYTVLEGTGSGVSDAPTNPPTKVPTKIPTAPVTSKAPTKQPTAQPTRTPTALPTSQPTAPPATPAPDDTTIRFTGIRLHGIGNGGDNINPNLSGNMNPLTKQRNFEVTLHNSSGAQISSANGNITYNPNTGFFFGTIILPSNVNSGDYLIKVRSDRYKREQITKIISVTKGSETNVQDIALTAGDSNLDGALTIADFNIIMDCYSDLAAPKNCSNAGKKLRADLTDDGKVNLNDYNTFLREASTKLGD